MSNMDFFSSPVKNIYCYWKREDTKYNDENMCALVFNTTGWDYGLTIMKWCKLTGALS